MSEGTFNSLDLEFRLTDAKSVPLLMRSSYSAHGRICGVIEDMGAIKGGISDPTASPFFGRNLNEGENILILKKLPGDITSGDIRETCSDIEGLKNVVVLPTCLTDQNDDILMVQAAKNGSDCSEQELNKIEEAMSQCYVKGRGPNSPLLPLQTAWLEFASKEQCDEAEKLLERRAVSGLCTLHPLKLQKSGPVTRRLKVAALNSSLSLLEDLHATEELILNLDKSFHTYPGVWPAGEDMEPETETADVDMGDDKKEEDKAEDGDVEILEKKSASQKEAIQTLTKDDHPFLKLL